MREHLAVYPAESARTPRGRLRAAAAPARPAAASAASAPSLWPRSATQTTGTKQLSLVECSPAQFTGHAMRAEKLREMPGGAAGNPRMGMVYRTYDKMADEKKSAIAESASVFLENLL